MSGTTAESPALGRHEPLKPSTHYFQGKLVIGLGESLHGTSTFWETRLELTQLLVKEGLAGGVAFEADFAMIDDIAASHGATPTDDRTRITGAFGPFSTQEQLDFLTWSRHVEKGIEAPLLWGMDFQLRYETCRVLVAKLRARGAAALAKRVGDSSRLCAGDEADSDDAARGTLAELSRRVEIGDPCSDFSIKAAVRALRQGYDLSQAEPPQRTILREVLMADNVIQLSACHGPVVVLAHNMHVGIRHTPWPSMGAQIASELEDNYFAVGAFGGEGYFNALYSPTERRVVVARLPPPPSDSLENRLSVLAPEGGYVLPEAVCQQETCSFRARYNGAFARPRGPNLVTIDSAVAFDLFAYWPNVQPRKWQP